MLRPWQTLATDNLLALQTFPDNTFDSIVTDPPAGIGFMGEEWDQDKGGRDRWVGWMGTVAAECLRVLKPGGHAIVWSLPRTTHWTALAWEDAGWEPRDMVVHLHGQGFPKSLDVEKALAKHTGGDVPVGGWCGWGTALKPSQETWWVFRKPLVGTVAENVLTHGVGALNIDGCRVGGRWPANVTLEHNHDCSDGACTEGCPVALLDTQSGDLGPGSWVRTDGARMFGNDGAPTGGEQWQAPLDTGGGASRFFFTAKASKKEKTAGGKVPNEHPTVKPLALMRYLCRLVTPPGGTVLDPFMGSGTTGVGAVQEGFGFVGIDSDPQAVVTAKARLALATNPGLWVDDPVPAVTPVSAEMVMSLEDLLWGRET